MGFSDTMKGLGRAIGSGLEKVFEIAGPPLLQAGTQAAVSWIQSAAMPKSTAPAYGYGYSTPVYRQPQVIAPTITRPAARAAVPQSWTPIQAGAATPAVYTPSPAYGYQPAAGAVDVLQWGAQQLFGNGGYTAMPEFEGAPGTAGGGVLTEAWERMQALVGGQTTFYRYGATRATPVSEIQVRHPETGKICTWKYMGRPILYSGDLAACKRVNRVARRVARRRPR